jgi:putative tricarboxylic transport membrane protein
MSERFFLLIMMLGGVVFLTLGLRLEAPFAYDPLGPRAFPVSLGGGLTLLCLFSMPGARQSTLVCQTRVLRLLLAMIFYLLAFQSLGFMPATAITAYIIARRIGCTWMQGLLTGMIISICFYGLFHFLLRVPLPLGAIFRVIG